MTDEDPERLASREGGGPDGDEPGRSLRSLIEEGRKELPSEAQLAVLSAKLGPILGGGGGGGGGGAGTGAGTAPGSGASAGAGIGAAKGVAIAVVGAATLGTLWQVLSLSAANTPPPHVAATATTAAAAAPADEPSTALPEPSSAPMVLPLPTTPALPTGFPNPGVPPPRGDSPRTPGSGAPLGAPSPDVKNEMRLLESAAKAIGNDPKQALALCDEAARRFPSGILAQEREVLAIRALADLGRIDAARARADAFRAKFPGSAQTQRVDHILSAH